MNDRPVQLRALLDEVRRRWVWRARLQSGTMGLAAASVALAAGWGAVLLLSPHGLGLLAVVALAVVIACGAAGLTWGSLPERPSDVRIARFVEERAGSLDDVIVTAVEHASRDTVSPRIVEALIADAERAIAARGLDRDLDTILSRRSLRRAALRCAAAACALSIALAGLAPSLFRAADIASAYLFPARVTLRVAPGTTKVRAGEPVTITATLEGAAGIVPSLTVAVGEDTRTVPMVPANAGAFAVTIDEVTSSFAYRVLAAGVQSDVFSVTALHPPRVERIDLQYEFPAALALPARTDEDAGDIYAPEGTRVRLSIASDKPLAAASLLLADGREVALDTRGGSADGVITVDRDGSYRVALVDSDGLANEDRTEYFIRTIDDRPPNVRIVRPASDRAVMPLEEVVIEAEADDDFGVRSLELVVEMPGREPRVVPLLKGQELSVARHHTLFLEDLGVQPGDLVSYYARARDVARGRRSREARSDIFFLEVKPFGEEFVAAQSQAAMIGGMPTGGLEELAQAQKQVVVATWNLDARARRAQGTPPDADLAAVSRAQAAVRERAQQANGRAQRMSDPRRWRRDGMSAPGDDPLGSAVESMGRAIAELDGKSTARALPHEMDALNHLLRALAEQRRRQVARGQQAGGGGGQNRAEADLSSLFDQELRRRQQTNYETPSTTETRADDRREDPLEKIRELARRQDAINRRQEELARSADRLDDEEIKRQLERLTREQNELRAQADELRRQIQSSPGGGQESGSARRLREVAEAMGRAARGGRQRDAQEAAARGREAAEGLREVERQLLGARPDERRRAFGDLHMESRELAEAQRRLADEASRTPAGAAGADARRRLAGDQQRLADRAARLQERIEQLSRARAAENGSQNEGAAADAARQMEEQRVAERMRESADALRQADSTRATARQQQEIAGALDSVARRLGTASGRAGDTGEQISEQLAAAQELRDKLQQIDRSLEELRRESGESPQAGEGPEGQQSGQGQGQGQGAAPSSGSRSGGARVSGGATNGSGGRVQELQRDVNQQLREAERLSEAIRRDHPGLRETNPDATWWRSFSAPGTEAFKQDFSRWELLKKNLLVALEDVERDLSDKLRQQENKERLNAGGHSAVSEEYRGLVEQYYRSLASPRRPR